MSDETWSQRIRRLRRAKGLSQQEAAALIGVHWVTISRWERGGPYPNELVQEKYVEVLRSV